MSKWRGFVEPEPQISSAPGAESAAAENPAGGTSSSDIEQQDTFSQQQERQARREELGLTLRDAAAAGDVQTIMYCLSRQGLGVNYSPGSACDDDDDERVPLVLWRDGGSGGKSSGDGRTALHAAAANGQLLACEILMQNGADLEALDTQHCSPIDVAMLQGHVSVLELLQRKAR